MKRKRIAVLLLLLVFLTGCGRERTLRGTVTALGPEVLVLRTDGGKEAAFRLTEDTMAFSWVEGKNRADLEPGVEVSVKSRGFPSGITAPDGTRYSGYEAVQVAIEAIREETPLLLEDGTPVWRWRRANGDRFCLDDGTELMWQDGFPGSLYSPQGSGEVNDRIARWAEDRGLLYDPMAELNRAYKAYRENPADFQSFHVGQELFASAAGEGVLYYCTSLTYSLGSQEAAQTQFTTAFDRETGAELPMAELFTCGEEEVPAILLASSGLGDEALLEELERTFRLEYLTFWSEGMEIFYPAGVLRDYETPFILSVNPAAARSVLKSWAVPESWE